MKREAIKEFMPIGYTIAYEDEEVLVIADEKDGHMCLVFDKYTIEMKWTNPGILVLEELDKLIQILKVLKEEQEDAKS